MPRITATELIAKINDDAFEKSVLWMAVENDGKMLLMINGKRGLYEYTGPNPFESDAARTTFLDLVRELTLAKDGDAE